MTSPVAVTIGHPGREWLRITVLGRAHTGATDYWDGNWVLAPITAQLDGFHADLPNAQLHGGELREFRVALEQLYERLTGEACLTSIDGWIDLTISGTGSGHLTIKGTLVDRVGTGTENRLNFTIDDYDQTFLPPLLDELRELESRYPMIGDPQHPYDKQHDV